jgi:hypothetical protein
MLLYITIGFFDSVGGGEGKVFRSAFGAVGEGCDPTVIPTLRTAAMLCEDSLYTETVVVQPPSQTDIGRLLLHRPLPPPPPKIPIKQTDGRSELIYKIDLSFQSTPLSMLQFYVFLHLLHNFCYV